MGGILKQSITFITREHNTEIYIQELDDIFPW